MVSYPSCSYPSCSQKTKRETLNHKCTTFSAANSLPCDKLWAATTSEGSQGRCGDNADFSQSLNLFSFGNREGRTTHAESWHQCRPGTHPLYSKSTELKFSKCLFVSQCWTQFYTGKDHEQATCNLNISKPIRLSSFQQQKRKSEEGRIYSLVFSGFGVSLSTKKKKNV